MSCTVAKALSNLKTCATENNLSVHDVPGDGNCLFHAVLYQLDAFSGTVDDDLRQMVASYLDSHRDFYVSFVPEPVEPIDPLNADNEPLDADLEISIVSDSVLRAQKVWERFIRRLKAGAWGNHVCVAAMANMFSATINVFKATDQTCFVQSVIPLEGESTLEVNIGLTNQNHYVGLDTLHSETVVSPPSSEPNCKPCVPPSEPKSNTGNDPDSVDAVTSAGCSSTVICSEANESGMTSIGGCSKKPDKVSVDPSDCEAGNSSEYTIDDETFDQGDEHTRQITGGPSATMMTIEDPDAFSEVVCVAPAEGQKPLFVMTDPHFESMSNPVKFPYGTGCFSSYRPQKLTYCDHFVWRQKLGRDFTASQARDHSVLSQCIRKDKAYSFMKNIRGSPPYYQKTFYILLLAMIRQLGTPTWFFTLSSADMKWPDIIQTIARQFGTEYTEEQVAALSFEEKSSWVRRNPVTAARHFQYRFNLFFSQFLEGPAKPLGEIGIRIEFQCRGSPHARWIKDAPKYEHDDLGAVCKFIDRYITCAIPEEGKLRDLVLLLQQHRHSSYCKRNRSCCFSSPSPLVVRL